CRCERMLSDHERQKIALFTNVEQDAVISAIDVDNIYKIPLFYQQQGLDRIVLDRLGMAAGPADLSDWQDVVDRQAEPQHEVTVAMVGKYVEHADAYKSLNEALSAGGLNDRIEVHIRPVESEQIEQQGVGILDGVDAILVPGGFGERGFEGKIAAIQYAREQHIPYLGICLGLQAAVVEFARNACGLDSANSTEIDPATPHPIIGLITEWLDESGQRQLRGEDDDLGGTMRLGAQGCRLTEGSRSIALYGDQDIIERHRHRYEFNNHYRDAVTQHGLLLAGFSMDGMLVEMIELPDHPWFVACQFHPEFTSTPRDGHPLFTGFIQAALAYAARTSPAVAQA
ncbi:MAG: CTP synthase, partial [Pseudomonadota bacterium]